MSRQTFQENNPEQSNGVSCSLEELIALKSKAEKLRFPIKHKSRSSLSGGKRSTLRGRGLDFEEVRAYQAGDEIRSIDWKVTARTGEAHTKIYREEKEKPVFILLDLRRSMFFGSKRYFKSVSACHTAAMLAWSALKHGDRLGGLIFSDHHDEELKPVSGNKAALNFMHKASDFSQALLEPPVTEHKVEENLEGALSKLQLVIRPGSLVYLISDFHDFGESCKQTLNLIKRHNDVVAIHIHDPLERQLPEAKRLLFTNFEAEDEAITEIQGDQKKTRQRYTEIYDSKYEKIKNDLIDCGVSSISLGTEEEIFEQLQLKSKSIRSK